MKILRQKLGTELWEWNAVGPKIGILPLFQNVQIHVNVKLLQKELEKCLRNGITLMRKRSDFQWIASTGINVNQVQNAPNLRYCEDINVFQAHFRSVSFG